MTTNQMQLYRFIYLFLVSSTCFGRCLGWHGTAVTCHPRHRPAATSVDNTRSCKYSHVLLMMGEDIAW